MNNPQPLMQPENTVTPLEKIERLEGELRQARARIADLHVVQEVALSLTTELNLEPLLYKILVSAVEVMEAAAGSLLLLDDLTDELVFAVIEGGGGQKLKGMRMPRDRGIAGWVAEHQRPLIVDDVNQDNRYYQSVAQSFDFPLSSLLCVPMLSHNNLTGVLQVMHSTRKKYFGILEEQLLLTFANQAAIAIENARLYENLKEERDRLMLVEDEIRKRLARDLHDGPTQLVSSIIMSLEFSKGTLEGDPEIALNELEMASDVAQQALKQLRTLLFDLRPVILETQGLVPALELYVEGLLESAKLTVDLIVEGEIPRLKRKAEIAIFAVVQEAVNNAKKYAEASKIELMIQTDLAQDMLTLYIRDDGSGFDIQILQEGYDQRGSLGMINMRERANVINGTFRIQSKVGEGTEVRLTFPLTENLLNEEDK